MNKRTLASSVVLIVAAAASMATSPSPTPEIRREAELPIVHLDDAHPSAALRMTARFPLHGLTHDDLDNGYLSIHAQLGSPTDAPVYAKVGEEAGDGTESGVFARIESDEVQQQIAGSVGPQCDETSCTFTGKVRLDLARSGLATVTGTLSASIQWDLGVDDEIEKPRAEELELSIELIELP